MKYYILIIFLISVSNSYSASNCSLENSISPKCYHQRNDSIFNVALIYYGDFWAETDLRRIEPILKKRFAKATSNSIKLAVKHIEVLNFKNKLPVDYQNNGITDPKRLLRLWYYDFVGQHIVNEIYSEIKNTTNIFKKYQDLDAVLAITGAQFEGLGFASGRMSVTEQPQEIAWGLEGGGRVNILSDY